jgi:hypothetical protein
MEFREGVGMLTDTLTLFRYNIFLSCYFIVSSMFKIIYLIFRNSVSYKIKCTIIKEFCT